MFAQMPQLAEILQPRRQSLMPGGPANPALGPNALMQQPPPPPTNPLANAPQGLEALLGGVLGRQMLGGEGLNGMSGFMNQILRNHPQAGIFGALARR